MTVSKWFTAGFACVALASCAAMERDLPLVEGPAITDVVTPFDEPLACLDGKIDQRLAFGVGNIPDATGREANSVEGAGRYVTQAAGDIVQSALFKTGVNVVNRRDVGTAALEAQWGIRALDSQQNAHFAITGSVNSLDFIPGGGAFASFGGVGAQYRQARILVGLDLAMTNVATGNIIANIALRKQMVTDDAGIFGTRFVNSRLVDADLGGARREALNDALRAMLQLATYELLVQLMPPSEHAECSELIDPRYGTVSGNKTGGGQYQEFRAEQERRVSAETADEEDAPEEAAAEDAEL